ncbi:hypothetical protein VD0002_g4468 [Verticillium dahliae]|uniref:Superoxide dismutase [Mn], mitochondrial n=1 Tax=Verticillium dahliae TaxID=27337 RepID=A0A2J8BYD2_VERDA|nr:superoxide dismutase [Verticillium dahliae]PNH29765.1 hypothetical protein BJF96_g6971 [Verticillium dahliae]PNH40131.1 hypothetical protein VD0004_g6816 [Verticillium dahliae]PNH51369.1 hypothetical protein VD0003_g5881 [Verticillium dahliae]PNH64099.1 hypothetical protein VD0002_g4468 [Verticillium dahliae]
MSDVASSLSPGAPAAGTTYVADGGQVQYAEMQNPNPPRLATPRYTLPPLPYAYDALEPAISAEIMTLHHTKHHQAYVTNLNAALAKYDAAAAAAGRGPAAAASSLADQLALHPALRFNAGGHINHSLFWRNLAPAASPDAQHPEAAAPRLAAAVVATWGSFDAMLDAFSRALVGVQGSGWGWLVKQDVGGGSGGGSVLRIVTARDQDLVANAPGETPIVGVDVWEHAYYLQYKNARAAYVDAVWSVINWTEAEVRYAGTRHDVLDGLLAYVQVDESS